ncbi:hypothetical protein [Halomonas denitrificans]|nr:hypothetical protein [Halomonas denitrificans]
MDQLSQSGYDVIVFILRGRIEHRLLILAFLKESTLPLFETL